VDWEPFGSFLKEEWGREGLDVMWCSTGFGPVCDYCGGYLGRLLGCDGRWWRVGVGTLSGVRVRYLICILIAA
jgi:hypothetical protein